MHKVPPPLLVIVAIGLEWALHRYLPIAGFSSPILPWAGWALIGLALLTGATCLALFARNRTTVVPHRNPGQLVVDGPYRLSRNPMYLSLACLLFGIAALFGSLSPFFVAVAFPPVMTKAFIQMEEANMLNQFGEPYREYCSKVRRWI